MLVRTIALIIACGLLGACATEPRAASPGRSSTTALAPETEPLIFGESFTIDSRVLNETRRINVLVPSVYGDKIDDPLPVLYMLDGGMNEDFLHIAGLVQILVSNGGMRPFMLVGIQNTERRRDLTGPTASAEDLKVAPAAGGSAKFRRFIRDELMPAVTSRYNTTDESAIAGESIAGLFVIETFFLEPDLFRTYIAVDPSLWWNNEELLKSAGDRLSVASVNHKSLFVAGSSDSIDLTDRLARAFEGRADTEVTFRYAPMPEETHATIYHPAALLAFRAGLAPPPTTPK